MPANYLSDYLVPQFSVDAPVDTQPALEISEPAVQAVGGVGDI